MRLAELDHFLVFRSLIGSLCCVQGLELDDHCQVSGIAFAHIRVQVPAKKTGFAFRQVGLKGLEERTHTFRVRDCSSNVPVTLGHLTRGAIARVLHEFPAIALLPWSISTTDGP